MIVDYEYAEELVTTVIEWCMSDKKPQWFNDEFIKSVYDQWSERGTITERQAQALENIVEKFIN